VREGDQGVAQTAVESADIQPSLRNGPPTPASPIRPSSGPPTFSPSLRTKVVES